MKVYEIKVKVYLLEKLFAEDALGKIAYYIDSTLTNSEEWSTFHSKNEFKLYTFNNLYPLSADRVYEADRNYTFIVRTVDSNLAHYFNEQLGSQRTKELVGLNTEVRIVPKKKIYKLHTLTPVIVKSDKGYWRNSMTLEEYEERLKVNVIKKYNQFMKKKVNENFTLYTHLLFKNSVPIKCPIKSVHLLGDKLEIEVGTSDLAQDFAYFLLGASLGEMGSRGYGYLNYVWY